MPRSPFSYEGLGRDNRVASNLRRLRLDVADIRRQAGTFTEKGQFQGTTPSQSASVVTMRFDTEFVGS
jgi:hypothetical protein